MHDGPAANQHRQSMKSSSIQQRIDALPHDQVHRRTFITTYQRTTQAVGAPLMRPSSRIPTGWCAGMSPSQTCSSWP